ncbi:TPA: hypothetical protein SL605_000779 [Pseudomonas aeruginosa]|nr:hypothetical protein [Pseudomonas aeruginosa]HCF2029388.1 hypothetical protein [Pseudomonas aeruginosa]HEJ4837992.1 hypothetical protein [Pseudomonas aeruginosa]
MSEVTITCWQCEESMTLAQRGDEDGQCPHCGVEVDLEDYLIAAKAEAQALREEVAQQKFLTKVENDALKMMTDKANELKSEVEQLEEELESLRARAVVVPERKLLNAGVPGLNRNSGWNACLDELARINGMTVSEGMLRGMAAFAQEIISGALEGGNFDGADLQESAERHGLIAKQVMNEPCRGPEEYCACAWSTSFPTECYRITAELRALLNQDKENGDHAA